MNTAHESVAPESIYTFHPGILSGNPLTCRSRKTYALTYVNRGGSALHPEDLLGPGEDRQAFHRIRLDVCPSRKGFRIHREPVGHVTGILFVFVVKVRIVVSPNQLERQRA